MSYSSKQCQTLINKYVTEFGGECTQLDEGVLGFGVIILHDAQGKKNIVIKEQYVDEWNCTHTIRQYNKLPKKYINAIE
jgi:hypothetical protein